MTFNLPTFRIVDPRVVNQFYLEARRQARSQGFSDAGFTLGNSDLTLSDVISGLREKKYEALQYYEHVIAPAYSGIPSYNNVPNDKIDNDVVSSYMSWVADIGEDYAFRKLHRMTVDRIVYEYPRQARKWRRADELSQIDLL